MLKLHKSINFYCWAWGIDIAIIFTRYLRRIPYYMEIHGFLMSILLILTLFFEVIIIIFNYPFTNVNNFWVWVHFLGGVAFLILLLI